ncbi:MAG: hypothetical protein KDE28_20955, partial [Anaerolineales bacterium]|nr:hypothetical protein [Anaerolineales bacterium]
LPNKVNDETLSAGDARAWEARRLAERLQALQREQFPVWADGAYRPFQFGDAAILFRATTNLPLYEAQFQAAGLPYLTVGGRGYYDRSEIQDLMALLAGLYNPADDLNLATALRSPLFSLNDETLYRLRWRDSAGERPREPRPFLTALADPPPTDQREAVAHAATVLAELGRLVRRVDVWQLLRSALDLTGYEAAMLLADRAG